MRNKYLIGAISWIILTVITIVVTNLLDIDKLLYIPIWFICCIIIIVLGMSILLLIYTTNLQNTCKQLQNNNNKLLETLNKNCTVSNCKILGGEGGKLVLLALSQNIYEPLKIRMLEEALEKDNLLAGLILGNYYQCGFHNNDKVLIEKDENKAYNTYKKVNPYDQFGITDWLIGWGYEKGYIDKSSTEQQRMSTAEVCYERAKNKGFPKAYNSLGKIYYKDKIRQAEAVHFFKQACDGGDIYGALNAGHYYMEQYKTEKDKTYLLEAKNYYEIAAKKDSNEGYEKLGIIYETLAFEEASNKRNHLENAKKNYISSFIKVENHYAASGYYHLGCLIVNHPNLLESEDIAEALGTKEVRFDDFSIECFMRAYEIFSDLLRNEVKIGGVYNSYYQKLCASFKSANKDDFQHNYQEYILT